MQSQAQAGSVPGLLSQAQQSQSHEQDQEITDVSLLVIS